jgi:hypothetical protein
MDKQSETGAIPRRVHAWLSPGQDWIVEIGGMEIVVRLVERRGRRARIAVSASAFPLDNKLICSLE